MKVAIVLGVLAAIAIAWLLWRRSRIDRKARVQLERRAERQRRRVAEWTEMNKLYGRKRERGVARERTADQPMAGRPEAGAAGED